MNDKEITWIPREQHPELFEDGEQLLVALQVLTAPSTKYQWFVEAVTIACDEDYFSIEDASGDVWGCEWDDVEFYIPLRKLTTLLPPTSEASK